MTLFERGLYAWICQWNRGVDINHRILRLALFMHEQGIHRCGIQDIDEWKKLAVKADTTGKIQLAELIIQGLPIANPNKFKECLRSYNAGAKEIGFELCMYQVLGANDYLMIKHLPKTSMTELCSIYI